jgi:hypothetical protein
MTIARRPIGEAATEEANEPLVSSGGKRCCVACARLPSAGIVDGVSGYPVAAASVVLAGFPLADSGGPSDRLTAALVKTGVELSYSLIWDRQNRKKRNEL